MSFSRKEREVVLDVETTGFSPSKGDRIIEIGVVELINHVPTGKCFHQVIDPGNIELSRRITEITGLRKENLVGKPNFTEVEKDLVDFIGSSEIIAHNESFDRRFINFQLEQKIPESQWLCSMRLAKSLLKLKSNKLEALCEHFDISLENRRNHGALVDSFLTAKVYARLKKVSIATKLLKTFEQDFIDIQESNRSVLVVDSAESYNKGTGFDTKITAVPAPKQATYLEAVRDKIQARFHTFEWARKIDFRRRGLPKVSPASNLFPLAVVAQYEIAKAFAIASSKKNEPDPVKAVEILDRCDAAVASAIKAYSEPKRYFQLIHNYHMDILKRG